MVFITKIQSSKLLTLLVLLLTGFLQGCEFGYGQPQEDSEFGHVGSANVLNTADGIGIFLAHRLVYRSELTIAPGDGMGKYFVDRWLIGTYDLKTGKTRIIHRLNKQGELNAYYSNMGLHEIKAHRVLVSGLGHRQGYNQKFSYGLLNIDSGELIQLPIEAEIAQQKFSLEYVPYLLDEAATLALLTPVLYKDGFEDARDLWIRRPTGEYNRIDTVTDYIGYRNGDVHFYSVKHKYMIYNLKTRAYRLGTRQELRVLYNEQNESSKPSAVHLWDCYRDGANRLCIVHQQNGNWKYETLPITVEKLDQS